jgi:flagellar biosynthetic protein FliO
MAASAPASATTTGSLAPSGADLLQYGTSFALVIVLLVGLLWALKRLQGARGIGRQEKRLQVVESMALGARHKVALIRVDHREVLVGITATQIQTLASWSQPQGQGADAHAHFQASMAQARAAFEKGRD